MSSPETTPNPTHPAATNQVANGPVATGPSTPVLPATHAPSSSAVSSGVSGAVSGAASVSPAPAGTDLPEIVYDDFAKIQLIVATVVEAAAHPNADKLLVLQIDIGNGQRRQICAGIKAWYDPASLVGKQIVVVKNLAPRPLRGQVSHGMLLAATDPATGNVVVLSPSTPVAPGSSIK